MASILAAAGAWAYLLLLVLSAAESSAFLGLAVPGETFVLAAGALAARGLLQVPWLVVVVTVGAVLGDTVGYSLGRRFGGCRDSGFFARVWSCKRMERANRILKRWGGPAVVLGRFVGLVRPVVPFAAGAVRLPYRSFLTLNVIGAIAWATATLATGYYGSEVLQAVFQSVGPAAGWLAAVVTVIVLGLFSWRRLRGRRRVATTATA
jgi:membrane-associated protein